MCPSDKFFEEKHINFIILKLWMMNYVLLSPHSLPVLGVERFLWIAVIVIIV